MALLKKQNERIRVNMKYVFNYLNYTRPDWLNFYDLVVKGTRYTSFEIGKWKIKKIIEDKDSTYQLVYNHFVVIENESDIIIRPKDDKTVYLANPDEAISIEIPNELIDILKRTN